MASWPHTGGVHSTGAFWTLPAPVSTNWYRGNGIDVCLLFNIDRERNQELRC